MRTIDVKNKLINVLFFLKPKKDVAFLSTEDNLRQALEKMSFYHYSCVPVLDKEGTYAFSLSEGDILWFMKSQGHFDLYEAEKMKIVDIPRLREIKKISINMNMESLVHFTISQNFVPVVDDRNVFIGIVTRHDILQYFYNEKEIED